MINWKKNTKQF